MSALTFPSFNTKIPNALVDSFLATPEHSSSIVYYMMPQSIILNVPPQCLVVYQRVTLCQLQSLLWFWVVIPISQTTFPGFPTWVGKFILREGAVNAKVCIIVKLCFVLPILAQFLCRCRVALLQLHPFCNVAFFSEFVVCSRKTQLDIVPVVTIFDGAIVIKFPHLPASCFLFLTIITLRHEHVRFVAVWSILHAPVL